MKTKLTLSVDHEIAEAAKQQAAGEGTSVSALFSELLLARQADSARSTMPSMQAMVGSLKAYAINDSKPAIRASHAKKHLN